MVGGKVKGNPVHAIYSVASLPKYEGFVLSCAVDFEPSSKVVSAGAAKDRLFEKQVSRKNMIIVRSY